MRFSTLSEWLSWQEGLHPSEIELGLQRVSEVWSRLRPEGHRSTVVTVGGTNGKGSTVTLLESMLRRAGYRVGSYTSPHLFRYNERIRIDGKDVGDEALCRSFERIDRARCTTSLTYFEFGTLAALDLFAEAQLDIVLLEVGLGGRLDAVNIIDADVAVVTSVDIDHIAWLGNDREQIGFEKAGIFRFGRAAVCGDSNPPQRLLEHAEQIGAVLYRFGSEFGYECEDGGWRWWSDGQKLADLPIPSLSGECQLNNAAVALQVLRLLNPRFMVERQAIAQGLEEASLPGRFQRIPGAVEKLFDVAHNPHAARQLAANLRASRGGGRTLAVVAMLDDKDVGGVISALQDEVDHWYLAGLDVARGLDRDALAQQANLSAQPFDSFNSLTGAMQAAEGESKEGDRIVVFGSFFTVAELLPQVI
ncbi:bifunctional folylpolyglutamate synthase/dihydrofolate synthase [Solemya pervernicosa gill symbiont]|uniref:Dihydrofolate synthase/folylpolyglutamate synthase n=2 Tax=Gammaproteobacteria incertae sedis TaxID=118884 RepID=A0A1T2L6X2_9GAMM|nr:bifunctional tetrahydrofolate synthase/dihydrofolate synthase [Candidatus Reidiella endopervernicosa]OOZ40823.1 bifunctional folylpolyglutamate synthase/dihydrofolate synthase [Solemya pervernicosa gill symbiont]QKQ26334.1 bifunctional tetrahydrofolate synthase/dihydrofolate synthase [Candidatus Reidiella endopervernicosa]